MCVTFMNTVFFFFNILFIYYVYNILSACKLAGQKRAPDLITDGCEPPCGCWELNSGRLEEQAMLLTSEPSLQPPVLSSFKMDFMSVLIFEEMRKQQILIWLMVILDCTSDNGEMISLLPFYI